MSKRSARESGHTIQANPRSVRGKNQKGFWGLLEPEKSTKGEKLVMTVGS
jgi:hypothetical protein